MYQIKRGNKLIMIWPGRAEAEDFRAKALSRGQEAEVSPFPGYIISESTANLLTSDVEVINFSLFSSPSFYGDITTLYPLV